MASVESVILAALFHVIFRFALYIPPPEAKLSTPGPATPSIIVCFAILDIIYDNRIIPQRFQNTSPGFKCLLESFMAICLVEVGMLIWLSIEHSIYLFAKGSLLAMNVVTNETYYRQEVIIIGAFTLPLSMAVLIVTAQATEHYHVLRRLSNLH